MGVNGRAAAQTLLSFRNLIPGSCLHYVWQAYKAHGARSDRSYPTAYDGWLGSPGKRVGDRNPPAGVPVYWGPRTGSRAGDVVISLGGGRVVATDYPRNGVVGTCTIAERERQIGRPYLGWTDNILGHPIDYGQLASTGGGQPAPAPTPAPRPPLEDDDMLMLTIGGSHKVALDSGVFRHFVGADNYETIKNIARIQDDWQDISWADLPALLRTYGCDLNIWDVRDGKFVVLDPLNGTVASGNVWTAAGATRAAVAGIKMPPIDPTPIVAAVREALANVGDDVTVTVDENAIAYAVADEQDRRNRERLG